MRSRIIFRGIPYVKKMGIYCTIANFISQKTSSRPVGGLIKTLLSNIKIIFEGTITFATGIHERGYSAYSELLSIAE
jgi:hypothetical protein